MEFQPAAFDFSLCRRNLALQESGMAPMKAKSTGTTIVAATYESGIVLGWDSRATAGTIVADKFCVRSRPSGHIFVRYFGKRHHYGQDFRCARLRKLQANSVMERHYKFGMTEAECKALVQQGLQAGMHGDNASGNTLNWSQLTKMALALKDLLCLTSARRQALSSFNTNFQQAPRKFSSRKPSNTK
ncbi:putative proteasome subunit beta type-2 [Ditylenchus destructor]|nr:putative proteasome subunit beta type-2 [Ditylenchus destructor]